MSNTEFEIEKAKSQQNNVLLAYVLWWFLGWLGIHRFYTGQKFGWLYIVLGITAMITSMIFIGYFIFIGLFVWWSIDGINLSNYIKSKNLRILEDAEKAHFERESKNQSE